MSQYGKNRQAIRRTEFKKTIQGNDGRKKREENTIQIRKEKRTESFQKLRNLNVENSVDSFVIDLHSLVEMVKNKEPLIQLRATAAIRQLLSQEQNPPIQEIIETGVVDWLVEFLKRNDYPDLQFEAAWALTNIASGSSEQTRLVIDSGAVEAFRDLLSSPNEELREQVVWALGNIAGDSPSCRDHVLSKEVMKPLLENFTDSARISMIRNATWTLSNLCRTKPHPNWELVSPALPTLAKLIHSTDDEILTDACWALCFLSDGPERIQFIIDAGIVKRMTELLAHSSYSIQTPALRTIGNIVTGNNRQTQVVIDAAVLPNLSSLLYSPKKGIKKEACWAISNITAGSSAQIQAVIQAQIFPRLIYLLKTADFDVRKEAAWAISNATSGGTPEQVRYMIDQNLLQPICELLTSADSGIILVALGALENILKVAKKESGSDYALLIEEAKGVDYMEALQNHPHNDIYEKASRILEVYFQAEEEEDHNTMPYVDPTNYFTFDPSKLGNSSSIFHF